MAEETDILWGMYQEHCTQGRHHEEQRATMSNLLLVLSGGVLGVITLKDLSFETWPLTVFLVLIGSFGSLFSAKHYEKFRFHMMAAARYRNKLEKLLPQTELRRLRREAGEEHRRTIRLLRRVRLHYFWTGLHVGIAILGLTLGAIVLLGKP